MTTKQLLAALALALCGPAFAAGNHAHEHQPLHGGIVTEVADIDYELVAQPDTLTLHLRDHGKPLALDGASAKLTLLNGTEFDSSHKRGQPASFVLNQVIPCWTQGVQKMKVGGTAKFTCPPETAYGSRDLGKIPPNSTLNFEVQLLGIR